MHLRQLQLRLSSRSLRESSIADDVAESLSVCAEECQHSADPWIARANGRVGSRERGKEIFEGFIPLCLVLGEYFPTGYEQRPEYEGRDMADRFVWSRIILALMKQLRSSFFDLNWDIAYLLNEVKMYACSYEI